jgi:hypothetical protein
MGGHCPGRGRRGHVDLLHFTRMVTILKKAADRPIGHVASAVMLNAKLKKGVSLMHVIAMTRSLGQLLTEKDAQPEVFTWTDTSQSVVTCTFVGGKLTEWTWCAPNPSRSALKISVLHCLMPLLQRTLS